MNKDWIDNAINLMSGNKISTINQALRLYSTSKQQAIADRLHCKVVDLADALAHRPLIA
jgi:hypothetical protein